MHEQYADAIEQIGQLLHHQLLLHEDHNSLLSNLDSIFRSLFVQIACRTAQTLVDTLLAEQTQLLKAQNFRKHRTSEVPFHFLYGTLRLESPYFWNRETGEGIKPLDKKLGIPAHNYTLALQQALVDFGTEESFAQAAQRFEEHYGWEPSVSAIRRMTLKTGQEAEEYVDTRLVQNQPDFDKPPVERPGVPELMAQLDGCNARIGELVLCEDRKKTKVRKLRKKKRIGEWKEVRIGLVRVLGEVEKKYVAQRADYPVVCQQLFELVIEKGLSSQTLVIGVSVRFLFYLPLKIPPERLRLNYCEYEKKGWPVGSGEVESAHRYIPQKRLKLPGAWWKEEHLNPMLALRVVRANGWWQHFWQQKARLATQRAA